MNQRRFVFLQIELKEQELAHEDIIKNLKRVRAIVDSLYPRKKFPSFNSPVPLSIQANDENITKLRQDYEREVKGNLE